MPNNWNIALENLEKSLFDISAKNPLINLNPKKLFQLDSEDESLLKKIYQRSQWYKREYDLPTLLYVSHVIVWPNPNSGELFISPFLYHSGSIRMKRKIDREFDISYDDTWEFNPVLEHLFHQHFDFILPKTTSKDEFISAFCTLLNTKENKIQYLETFDPNVAWSISPINAIGNFNYKKSLLVKDLQQIKLQPSKSLIDLLEGAHYESTPPKLLKGFEQVDLSQKSAINRAINHHLVIQGPPGTGKSHTIVSLIGQLLEMNKRVLFVSEKKSALEVVHNRLKKDGLGEISCFVNHETDAKKSFYNTLKKSWKKLEENPVISEVPIHKSAPLIDYYLEKTSSHRENLDASILDLIERLIQSPPDSSKIISGSYPELKIWQANLEYLAFLEKRVSQEYDAELITQASFTQLNKSVFLDNDPILILEKRLFKILEIAKEANNIQRDLSINLDLKSFVQLCVSASVLAMVNNVQMDLLVHGSKLYKSFNTWVKKYELTRTKLTQVQSANRKWRNKPSLSEVIELIDLIQNKRPARGILGVLKRQRLLNEKFAGFSPQLSDEAKLKLLESLRLEWRLDGELNEIKIKLEHNLGISNPEQEISLIKDLRRKLDQVAPNDYMFLLEQENHLETVRVLANFHPKLQEIQQLIRFIFQENNFPIITQLEETTQRIINDLPILTKWVEEVRKYFELPKDVRQYIQSNPYSVQELSNQLNYYYLLRETRFESQFKEINGANLIKSLKHEKSDNKVDKKHRIEQIINQHKLQKLNKEKLLITPASKLKDADKELKKDLRKGKKTILKELGKRQQHMPVNQLIEDSFDWIKDIFSVWIMNPLTVSEQLPFLTSWFDYVIFDESSQIPLEDSIPSIQRAKQIIVVGDEHQMPPSNFFSGRDDTTTLLQQAQLSFENVMLKVHYRSEHPGLIQFSNRMFYENELILFPPIHQETPIQFNKVDGVFENGINQSEALAIKDFIVEIPITKFEQYGIIAFSQAQAEHIEKTLRSNGIPTENLLIRNLENVQGIERDHILISVGYGYNQEGQFRLNFGPVNQEFGINRLNVLFTRAKKELQLFSSVSFRDFNYSDNPGVQMLQDFLHYAENLSSDNFEFSHPNPAIDFVKEILEEKKIETVFYPANHHIGFNSFVQHNTSKILLVNPGVRDGEIEDLHTIYEVLNKRFKSLDILLSNDILFQKEASKNKILTFFATS